MKITGIETFTVGAGWKNWLFVRVDTDAGIHGVGEGTLNGFIATTEAGVHELRHLAIGEDPRRISALAKRMLDSVSLDGGHIHRTVIAAIEIACWDILGKSLGVPVHQLLGGYRTKLTAIAADTATPALGAKQAVKETRALHDRGAAGVQIEIGTQDPDVDLDWLRTINEGLPEGPWLEVNSAGR